MSIPSLVRRLALLLTCTALVACSSDPGSSPGDLEDLPEEISVKVGAQGGTVKAKGVSLEIPEGALDKDVVITAKKVDLEKVVLPNETQETLSEVYEFGPKGTRFMKDVKVTFATEKSEAKAVVFFTKEGSDTDFEKLATRVDEKSVSAATRHFSLGFAGMVADDDELPDASTGGMDATPGDGDSGLGGSDASVSLPDSGAAEEDAGDGFPDSGPSLPDASVQETVITVTSVDPYGDPANQTWVAYQDGDGPWQELPAATSGTYTFKVSSERYGLAYVCAGASSAGNVLFAPASRAALNIKQMAYCTGTPPTLVSRSGSINPPEGPSSGNLRYTHRWYSDIKSWSNPADLSYKFDKVRAGRATDLVFGIDYGAAPTKINVLRGVSMNEDNFQGVDFYAGGLTPQKISLTVQGIVSAKPNVSVEFTVNNSETGMRISDPPTVTGAVATLNFASIPAVNQVVGDRHRIVATDTANGRTRSVESFSVSYNPIEITLPSAFTASIEQAGGVEYFGPSATFDDVGADEYTMFFNHVSVPNAHFFTTRVESGWFPQGEAAHTLTFPDLSAVPNFNQGWLPPTSQTVSVSVGAVVLSSDAQSTTRSTSEITSALAGNMPL